MSEILVRSYNGKTRTTLEYYGEAEPRLLQLREMFRANKVTRGEAIRAVQTMTGPKAAERDRGDLSKNDFIKWQDENLLAVRLYGNPGIIAALVLAPEGATEVEWIPEASVPWA